MVHHYEEETEVKAEEDAPDTAPKFNPTIVPPFMEPPPQSPPAYKSKSVQCDACPMAPPPGNSSVLPTVLVALSIAYIVGVATGAVLFPVSAE